MASRSLFASPGKLFAEGMVVPPAFRVIDDREDDAAKDAVKVPARSELLSEQARDHHRVVVEGPAAPGTQYEGVMSVLLRHPQHLLEPGIHHERNLRNLIRKQAADVDGGRGDERCPIGLLQKLLLVVAEDGHLRR